MPKIDTIRQGESFHFVFDRDGQDITGWTCLIELKRFPDDPAIISRTITPEGGQWKGFLTQTETMDLEVGLYYLIAQLSNVSTDEEEQKPTRLQVGKAWVIAPDFVPPGFLPTDLPGNAYWLDAADTSASSIISSGNDVSGWNDKSGNNINFAQGQVVARPTTNLNTINGKNVINFDGSDHFLVGSSATIKTIFHVARLEPGFPNFASLLNEAGADNESIRMDGGLLEFHGPGNGGGAGDFFFPDGEIRIDGVATINPLIALNTPFIISVVAADTPTFVPQISQDFNSRFWKGDIAEVIAYDRDLLPEEKLLVEIYLSDKWGIVLP